MQFEREIFYLGKQAGLSVLRYLNEFHGFIAGGAITSVFSGAHINDFDVYFPTPADAEAAWKTVERNDKVVETEAALSFAVDKRRIQLIKCITGTPESVTGEFDFSVCQGAFTLDRGFVLAPNFLHHLAQRRLVFNVKTEFPICSLFRTKKYVARGFTISATEIIKIGLAIQALKIPDFKTLKRQLMGIDTMFLKEFTDKLAAQPEKAYDFNETLNLLEDWSEKKLAALGLNDTELE